MSMRLHVISRYEQTSRFHSEGLGTAASCPKNRSGIGGRGAEGRRSARPLTWYDLLLELERAGEGGLRPFELERELLLPQYGVSRLIERVEKAGYLKRETCEDDGRGQRLVITESGRKLRRKMWPVYGQAIEDAVGARLTPAEARRLSGLLAKLTA